MNYNNEILENKAFSFFKQLVYNIALSICIILLFAIVLVYGFKFNLYEILSDSQYPSFKTGDMIVVKAQDEYVVGDIVKFDFYGRPTTHRLVCKVENNGTTYYVCHGDNVPTSSPFKGSETLTWEQERDFLSTLTYDQIKGNEEIVSSEDPTVKGTIKGSQIQIIQKKDIEGKVLGHFNNYGTYFNFIKSHALLFIGIVVGIWCINGVIQNEIDMKNTKRLEN